METKLAIHLPNPELGRSVSRLQIIFDITTQWKCQRMHRQQLSPIDS